MGNTIKVNGIGFNSIQLIKDVENGKESFCEFFKKSVWIEYNEAAQMRFIDELWLMALAEKEKLSPSKEEEKQSSKAKSK
jgi:hypothetical protein